MEKIDHVSQSVSQLHEKASRNNMTVNLKHVCVNVKHEMN